jgi:peptidoglycan/LPS O-acetylase OafA/YrhL
MRELKMLVVSSRAKPAKAEIHPSYRPDIDGLRAIAILSVLVHHMGASLLPGGFVGVDVFFVISGFLISSLIFKELENGGFRFEDFYIRRIRRIFPALILMMTASLVAGLLLLTSREFAQLSKHISGGAAFASNLVQWREAGYFDTDARLKPLLHLWSLGIEEQFYIFWPIGVVLAWRRGFYAGLLGLMALSFAFNIWRTPLHPIGAFYLPVGRAWELLAGSLLAYHQHRGSTHYAARGRILHAFAGRSLFLKDAAAFLGAALLVSAFVVISPASQFPGWWALLPVVGAVLLIWAAETAWLNAKLLSHPAVVYIGLISYPLYLWHWPLLAFLRITSLTEPSLMLRAGAAALSVLLAMFTYHFVEMPLRASRYPRRAIIAVLLAIMLVLGSVGYAGYRKEAAKQPDFQISDCSMLLDRSSPAFKYCRIWGDPGLQKTYMVWGDSHAHAWINALATVAQRHNARLVEVAHAGCPPVTGVRRSLGSGLAQACSSFDLANNVMDLIRKVAPQQILLVARWSLYVHGLRSHGELIENTFLTTDAKGTATPAISEAALRAALPATLRQLAAVAPVLVIKTVPTLHEPFDSGLARNPDGFEPSLKEYRLYEAIPNAIIEGAAQQTPNISVLDPATVLCTAKCHAIMKGRAVYSDDSHLTDEGAMLFTDSLSKLIKK